MIDLQTVAILSQKEVRDATKSRWLLMFGVGFAVIASALSWMALSGLGSFGVAGFGRTTASMVNMVLLIVPLMGLTLGALAIASERERGALAYLMSQPVTAFEILLSKYLGVAAALIAALLVGFGISGILVVLRGGSSNAGDFLALVGLTVLLALSSLSIGFLLSAGLRRGATAIGLSVFLWLTLAFFSDLGLMGTAVTLDIGVRELLFMALANPLQVYKLATILSIKNDLEVLGPAGVYAMRTYGDALLPILMALFVVWVIAPLGVGFLIFKRRGAF
ncbi:ABC transporter permease [Candidatus Lucifugimonas marina]|jgi:Cu-processing system permease protein|uniref:ABC transporter permease subunit n=1 Tax=Candidatus Lucifugimonas marina TaxID=3038979 RepID=A0AAJ5ZI90_9CHLR|nr:ABC transporter permease subunit [SAR202 cluster bacterium JH702]MDG0868660.1 ABC transporter permease subunit [SAR202 cluster bacterium JH639]WFG35292.1 ABC transporter permease subunit [SAR202 cluster bacterium JH545]WFG39242.1 ABC transporter permease subunit [SAR202 cluster bacterium JH1073]